MKKQLSISLVVGIIAALFTGLYLFSIEQNYKKRGQQVSVLISSQYIASGTLIDPTMVAESKVPKEYLQPKAIQTLKEVASEDGRPMFMAIAPIEQGEQLVATKLSILGMDTGISTIIPSEQRAFTLTLESEFVNGIIRPGNRVDIIGIFQYEDKNGAQQDVAKTILQDVLVLSVGADIIGSVASSKITAGKTEGGFSMAQPEMNSDQVPVSLSLTLFESEGLALATQRGTVRIVLRPSGEEGVFVTKGVKMNDMVTDFSSGQSAASGQVSDSPAARKELQQKQKEILQILNKYRK